MNIINPQTSLAEIVGGRPWLGRILTAFGLEPLDSNLSVGQVCRHHGQDLALVLRLVNRVSMGPEGLQVLSTGELIEQIIQCHHRYLRRVLPGLQLQAEALEALSPESSILKGELEMLAREANPHMFREEMMVFPALRQWDSGSEEAAHVPRWLGALLREHETALQHFLRLRELTGLYRVEARQHPAYRRLMVGLADLDEDMRWHMYAENDLLFPRFGRGFRAA